MRIVDLAVHRRSVTLAAPLSSSVARAVSASDTLVVEIVTDLGVRGWGEATPGLARDGGTLSGIEGTLLKGVRDALLGRSVSDEGLEEIWRDVDAATEGDAAARAGVDIALHDLNARRLGVPLYRHLGGTVPTVDTGITIGLDVPDRMAERAAARVAQGFGTVKLKVGVDERADLDRVRAVRSAIGDGVRLCLDANQGWGVRTAVSAIRRMEDEGLRIDLVEQPVPHQDIDGLATVRRSVRTPIAADEAIFSSESLAEVVRLRAADVLNVKLQKNGGIRGALEIVRAAESAGLDCMIGCTVESMISITAAVSLAAASGTVAYADLDAPFWMAGSFVRGGAECSGSSIVLPEMPGLGIAGLTPA